MLAKVAPKLPEPSLSTQDEAMSMSREVSVQSKSENVRVDVDYIDGVTLSFNFQRSTRIADLSAQISRAGRVRKVLPHAPRGAYIRWDADCLRLVVGQWPFKAS